MHENLTFLLFLVVDIYAYIAHRISLSYIIYICVVVSTTLWVGNLGEFVTDDVLSQTFQQASTLRFVPACVVRKPNMESLRYGFVTFRSEEEKEVSMLRMFD